MRPAAVGGWVAARLQARADRAGRLVAGQQALAGGHHGGGGGAQLLGVLAIVDRRSVGRAHHDGAAANDRRGRAKVERERGADEGEHDRANGEGTGITVDSTSCDRGRRVPGSLGHHWGEHGTANSSQLTPDAARRPGAPPHRPHPRRSRRVRCQAPRCRPPPRVDRMLDSARVVACSSCGITIWRRGPCISPQRCLSCMLSSARWWQPGRRIVAKCGLAPSFSWPRAPRHSRCARGRTYAGHRRAAPRCAAARRRRRQRARAATLQRARAATLQKRRHRMPERR